MNKFIDILVSASHLPVYLIMILINVAAITYHSFNASTVPYEFLSYALIINYLGSCFTVWWSRRETG